MPKIKGYILNQEEHHRNNTTKPILERLSQEVDTLKINESVEASGEEKRVGDKPGE